MSVEKLLEINPHEIPVIVTTSPDFMRKLAKSVDIEAIKRDVIATLQEHLEFAHKFSPDKSERRISRLELFLFDYCTPDIPFVEEVIAHVEPPVPLEGEGKSGWRNNFSVVGDMGHYWFLIQNGYYFLS